MIVFSLCNSCFQPYKINLQPEDLHLINEISDFETRSCACPRLCGGKINLTGMPEISNSKILKEPVSITGTELYKAVKGAGLPDEITKDPLVIEALMKAHHVVSIMVEEHNKNIFVHELRLSNGVTIHLTAGSRGAQVFKITK